MLVPQWNLSPGGRFSFSSWFRASFSVGSWKSFLSDLSGTIVCSSICFYSKTVPDGTFGDSFQEKLSKDKWWEFKQKKKSTLIFDP